MEVWHLIDRDHANINALIREIPNALNGPGVIRSRERLLADLMDELDAHASAVDASLLIPLSSRSEISGLVTELRDEHERAMAQLSRLVRYRKKGSSGWLNTFEDVTYLVDQNLHRQRHELLPMARSALSADELKTASTAFMRAKTRALQANRKSLSLAQPSSQILLATGFGLLTAGIALLAWRNGLLGGFGGGSSEGEEHGKGRGQPRSDLAAARAPADRRPGENLGRRQEQLLDEALEETFPASDPISPKRITR